MWTWILRTWGLTIFGPSAKAAEIEGSKIFSKELMEKYGVPTAFFKVCDNLADARAFVEEKGAPIVIKADGLAAGKGVVVAMTRDEALAALDEMMGAHKFGSAGNRVVIEEFMEGEEASLLAFTDGKTIVPMLAAQDHKRVNDGDQGPNTGGMGAYCPAPVMTDALKEKTVKEVLRPIVDALAKEGRPYSGCLYAGLMIKGDSVKVVEFNARFGDPETQVVLPLLKSDLAEIMVACANGTLTPDLVEWSDKAAVCVVMASGGYPASYKKGIPITGLKAANTIIGNPYDRKELLQIATEIEGHPDNVAPAIYGGFTISTVNDLGVECFAFRPKCNLQFVVAVPDFPLPTREARSVLPKMVKMSDAIYNIGRASMMVAALCRGNVRFLKNVFDDKLHQPFRAELIPGMYDVFEAARKAGAVGACLSGAGPSIIAFIDEERDNAERVGEAMRTAFVRHDVKAAILKPHLDTRGAYIVNDPLG